METSGKKGDIASKNLKNKKSRRKRKFKKRVRESHLVQPREPIPIDISETDNCTSLWQSVVIQNLYDIANQSSSIEHREIKAKALAWVGQGVQKDFTTDFEMVCELAQIDPKKVIACAGKLNKEGMVCLEGHNSRSFRKDYSNRINKKRNSKGANKWHSHPNEADQKAKAKTSSNMEELLMKELLN